ncbi:MAG: hypothetical protein QM582_13055 [Micropruina sp.]|uniref:hypothetical protein n=1 Tax=Micropruina sp. TaxID=2737536 RepID=UPI0039E4E906
MAALVVVGALLAAWAMKAVPGLALFSSTTESNNTQIIKSVERKEQVVLLSLGIQGIAEKKGKTAFLGVEVPGSERASFVQYTFNAKLGLEGKDVTITQAGPKELVVSIPEFAFLGHDDVRFRLAAENNGALSWVTPQIDTVEMINSILNDEAQKQYVSSNVEILRDQAKVFYTGIIAGVDPSITVRFEFRGA